MMADGRVLLCVESGFISQDNAGDPDTCVILAFKLSLFTTLQGS
jgi:hypothetical protein